MTELVKRLQPKGDTLRELFLKSGNLCAFPGCGHLMMDAEGTFIGQLCHIEAAEEGGERFNPNMTNEERRQAVNLVLMCYEHHQKTNDVEMFPVEKLRQLKADHENRFSRPDRAILETLKDSTDRDVTPEVSNLHRMNEALGWRMSDDELKPMIQDLNLYLTKFQNVPHEVRHFVGAISRRALKMNGTPVVRMSDHGFNVLMSDLSQALNLGEKTLKEKASEIESYELGWIAELDEDTNSKYALAIANIDEWPFWLDLVDYCEKANEPLDAFTLDLDFGRLDRNNE
ncbi:hypothetical protein [Agrobacterium tumefaciens]|uniref:hypothetical protein n=1 Tax=Agrobacterium tumefaciens TaxID=358 RepID=UPI001574E88B|nr:hypothetical protein [Agrobacterium tumefaciens]NTE37645.1 hypothetical protein [Agrobacterium tumefaciens]NTE53157.1 hypothetical protein [Agrobacterium tumefaciens]